MEQLHISDTCPPEVARDFADYVRRFELSEPTRMWDELEKRGWAPLASRDLSDEQLPVVLRRMVTDLSTLHYYIADTEHLDDRALFEEIVSALRDDDVVFWPDDPDSRTTLSLTGSGSEEDIQTWLRYSATPEDRALWAADFPDDPMPDAEPPPYPRDWLPERSDTWQDLAPSLFLEEGH